MKEKIVAGTRKSSLAMAQTNLVIRAVKKKYPDISCEIVGLQTAGDKILDRSLVSFGGKGIFIEEFEQGLLNHTMDFAVHSAKDIPAELSEGLEIAAVLEREDPRDVLIWRAGEDIEQKEKLIIGTGSKRREMQIMRHYACTCRLLRGNVNTRLEKLLNGEYDAIILAAAGLKRLELLDETTFSYRFFEPEEMVPSGGQGIIAIEAEAGSKVAELLHGISDKEAYCRLSVERYLLEKMQAGCHEPIGVYSELSHEDSNLEWKIRIMDGRSGKPMYYSMTASSDKNFSRDEIIKSGCRLADELLSKIIC
jgi:hydroxymethylbilane synthase